MSATVHSRLAHLKLHRPDPEYDGESQRSAHEKTWAYPQEMAHDLQDVGLPPEIIPEILGQSWEYTRAVIPDFTNYERYIAFTRLIAVAVVAEFKGSLVDVTAGDHLLGYDYKALLFTVYGSTTYYQDMCLEFGCYMFFVAQKCSEARNSDLFCQYADSLAHSPRTWFRLRDCDALLRFTFAAALTCNDDDETWFSEDELQLLSEIGVPMYDAVAFYKHRAEGEIHNTFAYCGHSLRAEHYSRCRDILWALDATWAVHSSHRRIVNLIRNFGGPLHMVSRRYRFVEEDLTIGRPETVERQNEARRNIKLWCRIDSQERRSTNSETVEALEQKQLLFPGLSKILLDSRMNGCKSCSFPTSYGTRAAQQFSCARLCDRCRLAWEAYLIDLPKRAVKLFPLLRLILGDVCSQSNFVNLEDKAKDHNNQPFSKYCDFLKK